MISIMTDSLYESYKAAAYKVFEQKIREEESALTIAQIEREKMSSNQIEDRIISHRNYITTSILTLNCSRCRGAILDFSDCFAVKHTCGSFFCAWCLSESKTSQKCHAHVMKCSLNPKKVCLTPSFLSNIPELTTLTQPPTDRHTHIHVHFINLGGIV